MGKAIKISAKFWESCSFIEKAFIEERAGKNDLVTLKSIIVDARKQLPGFRRLYGNGMVESKDGNIYTWSGSDTRKFRLVEKAPAKEPFRLWGRTIKIILPNGEEHAGQFAIVELDSIITSHDERTFVPSPGYPVNAQGRNANDRNYEGDKAAQALVQEYARDLKPELLITTSRTPEGTPIVTPDWIVVSGNNRTMSLKLAAANYPKQYKAYFDFLKEELATFGFKEGEFWLEFQKPVLVRVDYDIPEVTTNELAKYNQATTKGKRPIDQSIELSARLSETLCGTNIPQIIGTFDSLSEFYDNRTAQITVKGQLIACGLLTQQELPTYFDTANGSFNDEGKTFIERTLAASVLTADALQAAEADGVKMLRKAVVNALPALLENKGLPEGNLIEWVNQAVIFQQKMVASKLSFGDYLAQKSIFDTADTNHERPAVALNRLMNSGQRIFKTSLARYNDSVKANTGDSLFGAGEKATPDEAFEKLIFAALSDGDKKVIERYFAGEKTADNRVKAPAPAPEPPQPKYNTGDKVWYFDVKKDKSVSMKIKSVHIGPYGGWEEGEIVYLPEGKHHRRSTFIEKELYPAAAAAEAAWGVPTVSNVPDPEQANHDIAFQKALRATKGNEMKTAIAGLRAALQFADKTTKAKLTAAIKAMTAAQKFAQ